MSLEMDRFIYDHVQKHNKDIYSADSNTKI